MVIIIWYSYSEIVMITEGHCLVIVSKLCSINSGPESEKRRCWITNSDQLCLLVFFVFISANSLNPILSDIMKVIFQFDRLILLTMRSNHVVNSVELRWIKHNDQKFKYFNIQSFPSTNAINFTEDIAIQMEDAYHPRCVFF